MTGPPARYPPTSDRPRALHGARWCRIISGHDDAPGKRFDITLIPVIGASMRRAPASFR